MERTFRKSIASLPEVFSFLESYMSAQTDDPAAKYAINLAAEEFFTNMVKYNPESGNDISIRISKEERALKVILVDRDVEPFDVTRAGQVDVTARLESRKVGGLGIYLSRELLDAIEYEYSNRNSIITLTKTVEK
jgi:anti-sigma regulatory factor (Ser/Thr protein kinase)